MPHLSPMEWMSMPIILWILVSTMLMKMHHMILYMHTTKKTPISKMKLYWPW